MSRRYEITLSLLDQLIAKLEANTGGEEHQ